MKQSAVGPARSTTKPVLAGPDATGGQRLPPPVSQNAAEFETFWRRFPKKVGKLAARVAYEKARRVATAEEIFDGIAAYEAAKPSYADYCHPKTYLNQGRWLDERSPEVGTHRQPTAALQLVPAAAAYVCPHTPACTEGRWLCQVRTQMAAYRQRVSA